MKDQIQDNITIHASIDRVWELISEPGWWINKGTLGGHHLRWDGSDCVVTDQQLGEFRLEVLESHAPERIVFTWRPDDESPRTTVEFALTRTNEDSVTVRVTESGFATFSAEQYQRNYDANVSGWRKELGLAAQRFA